MSERHFLALFPSQSNYQMFLIEDSKRDPVSFQNNLSRSFSDYGLEVESTATFLDSFNRVQNTYISIFQALGALGLLIGTLGLASVLFRNVMERQKEFAVYSALGLNSMLVKKQVFTEHFNLFFVGLFIGIFCALVGILPRILTHGLPFRTLILVPLILIFAASLSLLWATSVAMKKPLLQALRRE